jgi:aspartate racemase
MKTIGVIAITVPGSVICQQEIARYAMSKINAGLIHPTFIVDNLNFASYQTILAQNNWHEIGKMIISRIKNLSALPEPIDLAIIPSNTPHYAIHQIQAESPVPVLSIIDITIKACLAQSYKQVLILGTQQTMQNGLYEMPLKQHDLLPILPPHSLMLAIHTLIYDIIQNQHTAIVINELATQIDALHADAVILGCTELPCVFTNSTTPDRLSATLKTPIIDTTRLLARAAVDVAIA